MGKYKWYSPFFKLQPSKKINSWITTRDSLNEGIFQIQINFFLLISLNKCYLCFYLNNLSTMLTSKIFQRLIKNTLTAIFTILPFISLTNFAFAENDEVKVGWIGPMSGPLAKYGVYEAALLAEQEVNRLGGINGKKLKIIYEDGKGEGKTAIVAAHKLINVDKVKFILGGHGSPESLAIAPVLEKNKVIMLAAITSNPKLSNSGDYIFRITAVSTIHSKILADFALNKLNAKSIAILFEETDYTLPPAEFLAELAVKNNLKITDKIPFHIGEIDFKTLITRTITKKPEIIYLGVQSPETAILFMRQLNSFNYTGQIFGNEITGNAFMTQKNTAEIFEGLIFAEPQFENNKSPTKEFIELYEKKYKTIGLPNGIWTAEAYDTVFLLSNILKNCGLETEQVKKCLYQTKNFIGASGKISIDKLGDGIRNYQIKKIRSGKISKLN